MGELEAELKEIERKVEKLKSDVVYRPSGSRLFASLYQELYSSADTIFGEQKMLQIISALEEDHEHKVSIEETWQSSTCQFVHGIARNYYGFEDVTIPIFSCVYQIKQGFRLLLLNRKKCLSSESQGSEVNVLLGNLMSLPSHRSIVNIPFEKLSGRSKIDVLHALLNHLVLVNFRNPNKKSFEEFDAIFREYVNVWQVCSAERRERNGKFKYL